jgi:hypothetical protein
VNYIFIEKKSYGNCWAFNSGKDSSGAVVADKVVTKPGFLNGLQLVI